MSLIRFLVALPFFMFLFNSLLILEIQAFVLAFRCKFHFPLNFTINI